MEIVIFIKNILLYYNYIYKLILLTVFEITQKVVGWLGAPTQHPGPPWAPSWVDFSKTDY